MGYIYKSMGFFPGSIFLVWRDPGVSPRAEFLVYLSNHVSFTPRLLYSITHHSPESFTHLKTGWAQDAWLQWSHQNWHFHLDISRWPGVFPGPHQRFFLPNTAALTLWNRWGWFPSNKAEKRATLEARYPMCQTRIFSDRARTWLRARYIRPCFFLTFSESASGKENAITYLFLVLFFYFFLLLMNHWYIHKYNICKPHLIFIITSLQKN